MSVVFLALVVALALLAALAVFQIGLASGAPWGRFAWGGAHGVLPARLRIASGVSALLYAAFALLLLSRSGALAGADNNVIVVLTWVLFAYFVVGIGLNAISRSRAERWTMTPVCLVLALTTLVVALS